MRNSHLFIALIALMCCAFTYDGGQHFTSDGSLSDTQAAINAASNTVYCTVAIPAGSFNWAGTLYQSNLVKLVGANSGRVLTRSTTSLTVGTGTQTLTVETGITTITNNQVVTIERTGGKNGGNSPGFGARTGMKGTVTSYNSGTGSLVVNVTNTFGSGTQPLWFVYNTADTTISNAAIGDLIKLYESKNGNSSVSGIRFVNNGSSSTGSYIEFVGSGNPSLVHDCYFESTAGTYDCIGNKIANGGSTTHGVVWNCSFVAVPFSLAQLAVHVKITSEIGSWLNASTKGLNDTGGTNNFYVENCDFEAWLNAFDFDDEAKGVVRANTLDNAGIGSHGADTSNYGMRHVEVYNNKFLFNGYNTGDTMNINQWFFVRGGTWEIMSNTIPAISSTDFGSRSSVKMIIEQLQRSAGPHGCWGAGTTNGAQYFAPRQPGLGRVTGIYTNDAFTYVGDSEPIYGWSNSGTGGSTFTTADYGHGSGDSCAGNTDSTANYVVVNRDFFTNTVDSAYPGTYTYPHPLVSGAAKYYVSTTGSGSNPGTLASPWDLATGAAALTNGNVVIVLDGQYAGVSIPQGSGPGTLIASNKWKAVITSAVTDGINFNSPPNSTNIIVSGICVSNVLGDGISLHATLCTITDCWITNAANGVTAHDGINSSGGISNSVFRTLVEGTHQGSADHVGHGIYVGYSGNVLQGNVVRNNNGYGLHFYAGTAGEHEWDNIVANNLTYGHTNQAGIAMWGAVDLDGSLPGTNTVTGNTILDGMNVKYGTLYATNNIILPSVQDLANPIHNSGSSPTTIVADYNLGTNAIAGSAHEVVTNYAGIAFVNPNNGLYWLTANAGARVKATSNRYYPINFFGNQQGIVSDIGAFQYTLPLAGDTRKLDPSPAGGANYWGTPTSQTNFVTRVTNLHAGKTKIGP